MLLTMTQSGKSNHSKNSNRRISQCAGCGSEILDQYILKVAPDLEWHASCLKCAECQQVLNENSTCFVRQDKTYCKRDYNRLFGARCRLCRVEFKENDLVMRAKNSIYHTECFRCIVCDRVLSSGDEFCIREKGIYCKVDIDTADKQDSEFNNNNNNNDSQKTETASDETKDSCEDVCMVPASNRTSNGKSQSRSESRSRSHKSDHKATRVRTVLNERQLHMLRTCYGANPRPDALMKEQLVEMTGLSPRVIRVWFQNKRCKDKKRTQLLKQIQQQQQDKLPDFQGDPCELDDSMWLKGKNNAVVNFSPEHQQAWMTSLDAHMFHPWKSLEHDDHSSPHHHHHLPHQQHQQLAFQQLMRNNFAISGDALCDDDDDAIVCLKESSHHNLMSSLDYSDDIYPGRDNSN